MHGEFLRLLFLQAHGAPRACAIDAHRVDGMHPVVVVLGAFPVAILCHSRIEDEVFSYLHTHLDTGT